MDTLGLFAREDLYPHGTSLNQVAYLCFTGLRNAARLLIRHARNIRRQKYGKSLLRMSVKKPSMALKTILRTSSRTPGTPTLPTDLSIL